MSFRDASYYSVLNLRNLLQIHGLSTRGAKEDLIARLNKHGLLGAAGTSSFPSTVANNDVASRNRELDLRRENALVEREFKLMRREIDLMRRELELQLNMQRSTVMAKFGQQGGFNL